MRANHLLTVTLRKVGQVDLWGRRLNNLARADVAALAHARSIRIFVYLFRFSLVHAHAGAVRESKAVIARR